MVGKAWRLARTRRRRAAWAAEAVSVVWLAAVIAPVTGGANWLTSPMMVLRQALAPCSDLAPGTSAPRYRLRLNALEPRVQTDKDARGRSVRMRLSGWRSEGPRGSA